MAGTSARRRLTAPPVWRDQAGYHPPAAVPRAAHPCRARRPRPTPPLASRPSAQTAPRRDSSTEAVSVGGCHGTATSQAVQPRRRIAERRAPALSGSMPDCANRGRTWPGLERASGRTWRMGARSGSCSTRRHGSKAITLPQFRCCRDSIIPCFLDAVPSPPWRAVPRRRGDREGRVRGDAGRGVRPRSRPNHTRPGATPPSQ